MADSEQRGIAPDVEETVLANLVSGRIGKMVRGEVPAPSPWTSGELGVVRAALLEDATLVRILPEAERSGDFRYVMDCFLARARAGLVLEADHGEKAAEPASREARIGPAGANRLRQVATAAGLGFRGVLPAVRAALNMPDLTKLADVPMLYRAEAEAALRGAGSQGELVVLASSATAPEPKPEPEPEPEPSPQPQPPPQPPQVVVSPVAKPGGRVPPAGPVIQRSAEAGLAMYATILVYGPSGVGKTLALRSAPGPLLVISSDPKGWQTLKVRGFEFDFVECDTYGQCLEALALVERTLVKARADGEAPPWSTVAFDHLGALDVLLLREIGRKGGDYVVKDSPETLSQQGWGVVKGRHAAIRDRLTRLQGVHVIVLAQPQEKTDPETGLEQWRPGISGSECINWPPAVSNVFAMLVDKTGGRVRRVFRTVAEGRYYAKCRGGLAREVPADFRYVFEQVGYTYQGPVPRDLSKATVRDLEGDKADGSGDGKAATAPATASGSSVGPPAGVVAGGPQKPGARRPQKPGARNV